MRNVKVLLQAFSLAVILAGSAAYAQTAPTQSSPLADDKVAAKEKAVADHAKKKADCKQQAKDQKLGVIAGKKFVSQCMAAK